MFPLNPLIHRSHYTDNESEQLVQSIYWVLGYCLLDTSAQYTTYEVERPTANQNTHPLQVYYDALIFSMRKVRPNIQCWG